MSSYIYPGNIRGLGFPVKKLMGWDTLVETAASGYESDVPLYMNPMWQITLPYNYLNDDPSSIQSGYLDTDLRTLQGFYGTMMGRANDFLFFDPTDYAVVKATQTVVEDVNGIYYTPLQRPMGGITGGAPPFMEDITDIVAGSLTVYANGTPTTNFVLTQPGFSAPGVSFYGLVLVWAAQPTAPVTASFQFYYRVRFMKDDDFEVEWWSGLNSSGVRQFWRDKAVKLYTSRVSPQL